MGLKRILKRFLNQSAIYWAPTGERDSFGKMILDDPIEIKCRWEDKSELVRTKAGSEITSRAQVFTEIDLVEEGVLWLNTGPPGSSAMGYVEIVDDADGNPDPYVNERAWEVMQFGKQPDRKARNFLRWAWL